MGRKPQIKPEETEMHNIEITVPIDYLDPMVIDVSYDTANLGWKKYKTAGEFKYTWTHEHLTRADVATLIEALQFAHAHMAEEDE